LTTGFDHRMSAPDLWRCMRALAKQSWADLLLENEELRDVIVARMAREAIRQEHVRSMFRLLALFMREPLANDELIGFLVDTAWYEWSRTYTGTYASLLGYRGLCLPPTMAGRAFPDDVPQRAQLYLRRCLEDEEELASSARLAKSYWATMIHGLSVAVAAHDTLHGDSVLRDVPVALADECVDTTMIVLSYTHRTRADTDTLARYTIVALREVYALLERLVQPRRQRRLLLRRLVSSLALGMRVLRRNPAIRPYRSTWRQAEETVAGAIAAPPLATYEELLRNRLDLLAAYYPRDLAMRDAYVASVPEDTSGVLYFYTWTKPPDESGRLRAILRLHPWVRDVKESPTIVLEILRWRTLLRTALRFVRWQHRFIQRGGQEGVEVTPLLHIRPDDFAHVKGAPAWLVAVAQAAGESAVTGLLFEHPQGRQPSRYVDRVARCVVWLAKRGVFYDRFDPSYVHPGLFVSGMSAWRHGPNDEATLSAYWRMIGPQVVRGEDTTEFDAAVRSYYTPGAPVISVPVPVRVPVAPLPPAVPTGMLVSREWWEDIEVVSDLTRKTAFDAENGPFMIHIAAEARLDGQAVYIELVDEPIYQQYYRPLLAATRGFLLEPVREEAIPLDRIPAAWQSAWRAALDEDVRERVEEERVIAQLRNTAPGSAVLTEKKYRIRTIEPLGPAQVPFASGRLRLLMYDALPAVSPVDLFSEPYEGVDALGALTRGVFRAAQQSGVGGLVLDGASLDRLVLPLDGGQLAWCGVGRFVPWPVYCSYAKRATHGFYARVLDDEPPPEDEDTVEEEAPYHLIVQYGPTFAQSWKTAAQRYNAGDRDQLAATLAERTGLMAPPDDADDAGGLIVMGIAMTEGQTGTQFKVLPLLMWRNHSPSCARTRLPPCARHGWLK
jgi:hypothetical protein